MQRPPPAGLRVRRGRRPAPRRRAAAPSNRSTSGSTPERRPTLAVAADAEEGEAAPQPGGSSRTPAPASTRAGRRHGRRAVPAGRPAGLGRRGRLVVEERRVQPLAGYGGGLFEDPEVGGVPGERGPGPPLAGAFDRPGPPGRVLQADRHLGQRLAGEPAGGGPGPTQAIAASEAPSGPSEPPNGPAGPDERRRRRRPQQPGRHVLHTLLIRGAGQPPRGPVDGDGHGERHQDGRTRRDRAVRPGQRGDRAYRWRRRRSISRSASRAGWASSTCRAP